jgi:RNA recognition motif-containing protein
MFKNYCACLFQVITDRLTGKSKGYGFVRFLSSEERDRALRHMDGHIMGGKAISVSEATLKKYKSDGAPPPPPSPPITTIRRHPGRHATASRGPG